MFTSKRFNDSNAIRAIATVLPIAAGAFFVRLPGVFQGLLNPDEATIAVQAQTMLDGGRLYIDTIDRKPPVPAYIYLIAGKIGGTPIDLGICRLFATLSIALAAVAIAFGAGTRSVWGRVAVGIASAVALVALFPDNAQAANYAQFAVGPGALAIVLSQRKTIASSAFCGAALGAAVLCRQTWAIGIIPVAVAAIFGRRCGRYIVFLAAAALTSDECVLGLANASFPLGRYWQRRISFVTT